MPEIPAKLASHRRPLLLAVCLGLVLILGATVTYLSTHPSLVLYPQAPSGDQAAADARQAGKAPAGQAASSGMGDAAQNGVMQLMQRLQTNPGDQEALLALTEHFMHLEDWQKAETFALRALVATPGAAKPLFLLGIIQHGQGRHTEAAATLQKALQSEDNPPIRYSLGMLYAYYLDNPEEGLVQLRNILDNPTASAKLKAEVAQEIEKIKEHGAHTPQN